MVPTSGELANIDPSVFNKITYVAIFLDDFVKFARF
jgi:hypothetical protein